MPNRFVNQFLNQLKDLLLQTKTEPEWNVHVEPKPEFFLVWHPAYSVYTLHNRSQETHVKYLILILKFLLPHTVFKSVTQPSRPLHEFRPTTTAVIIFIDLWTSLVSSHH